MTPLSCRQFGLDSSRSVFFHVTSTYTNSPTYTPIGHGFHPLAGFSSRHPDGSGAEPVSGAAIVEPSSSIGRWLSILESGEFSIRVARMILSRWSMIAMASSLHNYNRPRHDGFIEENRRTHSCGGCGWHGIRFTEYGAG